MSGPGVLEGGDIYHRRVSSPPRLRVLSHLYLSLVHTHTHTNTHLSVLIYIAVTMGLIFDNSSQTGQIS